MSNLILLEGEAEANAAIQKRQTALKVVDALMKMPRPQKWIAARNVWVALSPANANAHREAVLEVREAKEQAYDTKYGRSKAALGLAHGQKVNKNTSMRLLSIFPEPFGRSGLKDFLKRVDPHFLAMTQGKEYRKNWRLVCKAFPEYTVPEEVTDYYEGQDARVKLT